MAAGASANSLPELTGKGGLTVMGWQKSRWFWGGADVGGKRRCARAKNSLVPTIHQKHP